VFAAAAAAAARLIFGETRQGVSGLFIFSLAGP
jgi:hypothetical protein